MARDRGRLRQSRHHRPRRGARGYRQCRDLPRLTGLRLDHREGADRRWRADGLYRPRLRWRAMPPGDVAKVVANCLRFTTDICNAETAQIVSTSTSVANLRTFATALKFPATSTAALGGVLTF